MRGRYIATLAAIGMFVGSVSSPVDAAVVTDFNGRYELQYTSAAVDFDVTVVSPKGQTYAFPVSFTVAFDASEKIPYSAADPLLQNAALVLDNYYPQMPDSLQAKIIEAFGKAIYSAVDEINVQAEAMPDFMSLSTVSSKTGTVSGVFVDESAGGQTSMVGTLVPQSNGVGLISLLPFMEGSIDSTQGFVGAGDFYAEGLSISEVVKGYSVGLMGDTYVYFNMYRQ